MDIQRVGFLIWAGISVLLASCGTESFLSYDKQAVVNSTNRAEAILLQNRMRMQKGSMERFQRVLNGKKPLYDYVKVSTSQDYGLHFWIPYSGEDGVVEGSIVYPLDEEKPLEERSLDGELGMPVVLDADVLNNGIPENRRYLYSWMFRELKDLGLQVKSGLTDVAVCLESRDMGAEATRSQNTSLVIGGYVTIYYQLSSCGYVDPRGYPVVSTVSKETIRSVFEMEYRGHVYRGIPVALEEINHTLAYSLVIQLYFNGRTMYLRDAEIDVKQQLFNIANTIKRCFYVDAMFQYSCNFSTGNGAVSGGGGVTGTKDSHDMGGKDPDNYQSMPCYNFTKGKANPLVEMGIMPPNSYNKKGARFGVTRVDKQGNPKHHSGIDLAAFPETSVYCMYTGYIVGPYVTEQPNRDIDGDYPVGYKGDTNAAGNRFGVASEVNGRKIVVYYWHLSADNPVAERNGKPLQVGDRVHAGEIIGYTGVTGNADPKRPHLHLTIKDEHGQLLDPEQFLNGVVDEESCVIITPCD